MSDSKSDIGGHPVMTKIPEEVVSPRAPSLHEIAAMPFPASQDAMRKYYDPSWGKPIPEGKLLFRVRGDWTISGTMDETIEAETAEEAKELAREYIMDEAYSGDAEIEFRSVEELNR